MQIFSLIAVPFTYACNYFKQSSWLGKTIEIGLAGLATASLAYLAIRRLRTGQNRPPARSLDGGRAVPKSPSGQPPAELPGSHSDPKQLPAHQPGKSTPLPYADKPIVKECLKSLDTPYSYWDSTVHNTVKGWTKESPISEVTWIHNRRWVAGKLSGFVKDDPFQMLYNDPLLQGYDFSGWKTVEQQLRQLNAEVSAFTRANPPTKEKEIEICLSFKARIQEVVKLDLSLREYLKTGFIQCLERFSHLEFVHIADYLNFLNSDPRQDEAVFGLKRESLANKVGIVRLEDIQTLDLRKYETRIETLLQLCWCLKVQLRATKVIEVPIELKNEIEAFLRQIRIDLVSGQSALTGMQPFLERIKKALEEIIKEPIPAEKLKAVTSELQDIKKQDRERQQCLLKAYVGQHDIANTWKTLKDTGIHSLTQYHQTYPANNLYRIGFGGR